MDLREMPLHSFAAGYLYRLDEFSNLQEQQRIQVRAAAHAMHSDRESVPNSVCGRLQTYADVCRCMLTYADVCWGMLT